MPFDTEEAKEAHLFIRPGYYDRLMKIFWLLRETGQFMPERNPLHWLLSSVLIAVETGERVLGPDQDVDAE